MPVVYLKNKEVVQVSLEDLEDYLYDNAECIETRRKQTKRLPKVIREIRRQQFRATMDRVRRLKA